MTCEQLCRAIFYQGGKVKMKSTFGGQIKTLANAKSEVFITFSIFGQPFQSKEVELGEVCQHIVALCAEAKKLSEVIRCDLSDCVAFIQFSAGINATLLLRRTVWDNKVLRFTDLPIPS